MGRSSPKGLHIQFVVLLSTCAKTLGGRKVKELLSSCEEAVALSEKLEKQ